MDQATHTKYRPCIYFIQKHEGLVLDKRQYETLNLNEILGTIQEAWKSPNLSSSIQLKTIMNEKYKKSSSYSCDLPSPILLRRRLSAPETIMRKHVLAQQRSSSQEAHLTQKSETKNYQLNNEMSGGSYPNLSRRKDCDVMRKSTLLRRLWSTNKGGSTGSRFSGTFSEWQQSFGKLTSGKSTHSLTSSYSSTEDLIKSSNSRKTSPQHKNSLSYRKPLPIVEDNGNKEVILNNVSPKRKVSVYNNGNFDNYQNYQYSYSSGNTTTITTNVTSSTESKTSSTISPKTTTETENYSTRSTSYTTYSENSETLSANNKSNLSLSPNNNTISEITAENDDKSTLETDKIVAENIATSNNNSSNNSETYGQYSSGINESATQTNDFTNLNVISNVKLSESTLDLIFNHVMQDVNKTFSKELTTTTNEETKSTTEPQVINVQQIPSFYLKQKNDNVDTTNRGPDHSRIVKYMISNIGTGSPYTKPPEIPQVVVPRFSALPRTTSMEVNISSGDSEDKESDTLSLVDSLEDPHSPRIHSHNHDEKPVRGNMSPLLLPDNSERRKSREEKKSASFFIPIEKTKEMEVKATALTELLPGKVREKLTKRQQKREEKIQHSRSKQNSPRHDLNYVNASDNPSRFVSESLRDLSTKSIQSLPQIKNKFKRKNKPMLPRLETNRKVKVDRREPPEPNQDHQKLKQVKRKCLRETALENNRSANNKSVNERISPIYTSKNEYICDENQRKIYHKSHFSKKRIEILEIMECVDANDTRFGSHVYTGKSKIPVLVQKPKSSISIQERTLLKPAFLDLDQIQMTDDLKLDQLIANILIDTLNTTEIEIPANTSYAESNKKVKKSSKDKNLLGTKQKFEVIPEESSNEQFRNLNKDFSNNNEVNKNILTNTHVDNNNHQQEDAGNDSNVKENSNKLPSHKSGKKTAVAVVRDQSYSTIPKGWITFYMLHKNDGSPDSTSDEGKILENNQLRADHAKKRESQKENITKIKSRDDNYTPEENYASPEKEKRLLPPLSCSLRQKNYNYPRSQREENNERRSSQFTGEWSVLVSGSSSHKKVIPEVEMKIKFSNSQQTNNSQSDSGLGEENIRESRYYSSKPDRRCNNVNPFFDNKDGMSLPQIHQNKRASNQKRSGSSMLLSSVAPKDMEPRQTRTSTRRYYLSRPRNVQLESINLLNNRLIPKHILLKHFPEILTVRGRSMSPENRDKYFSDEHGFE